MSSHLFPDEIWLTRPIHAVRTEDFILHDSTQVDGEKYVKAEDAIDNREERREKRDDALEEMWTAIKEKIPGLQVEDGQTDDDEENTLEETLDEEWERLKEAKLGGVL